MKENLLAIGLAAITALLSVPAFAASKGALKVAGSTTVLPIAQVWAEAYMQKHPDANVIVSGGGSGVGISMLVNGLCQVANASREAKKKEIDSAKQRNAKMVQTKIAKDGLSIIVHPSNTAVKNLTVAQIAGIYKGSITNWKQVGGESKPIIVMGRDSSSGTYGFLQLEVLDGAPYTKDMLCLPSNVSVADSVSQTEGAIGYVGMAFADEYAKRNKVKILSISAKTGQPGMTPTEETVRSGKYPLFRYLYIYTLGKPSGAAGEYIKFGLSPEGQDLVKKAGYMPVS